MAEGRGYSQSLVNTFKAGADLSSSQYTFVKISADNTVVSAGDNEVAIGVLMNKPASGEPAEVYGVGTIAKVICGEAVAVGSLVRSDANGKATDASVASPGTNNYLGIALQSGSAGDIIEVKLIGLVKESV